MRAKLPASLPLLVADLRQEGLRDVLEDVALDEGIAYVPLVTAPREQTTHALEVYSPDSRDALQLLADPAGEPTENGYPLRLRVRELVAVKPRPDLLVATTTGLTGPPTQSKIPSIDHDQASVVPPPIMKRPVFEDEAQSGIAIASVLPPAIEIEPRSSRVSSPIPSLVSTSSLPPNERVGAPPPPPSSASLPLPPPTITLGEHAGRTIAKGRIGLESIIGGGGAGAVYRARHHHLAIPVAVKVLLAEKQGDEEYSRRFHAEAQAASRLDHPNITRVLDFGQETDGLLYFVMEFLHGVGLRVILDREKRLHLQRIAQLGSQICAGLAHAHDHGIIHKDLKPENLVIVTGMDDDQQPIEIVKVCDFGIAQGADDESRGLFAGTPDYMSPEQVRGEVLDARSDVYSCGVVLYELATGEVPFTGADARSIMRAHLKDLPMPPSKKAFGVDERLEEIIMIALAKDREQRFLSMRELRASLRDLLDSPFPISGQFRKFESPLLDLPNLAANDEDSPVPPVRPTRTSKPKLVIDLSIAPDKAD